MDEELTIWRPHQARHEIPTSGGTRRFRNKRFTGLQINKFVKQNPEVVIRALLAICAVSILLSCVVTRHTTEARLREEFKIELTSERFRTEQETVARLREEYGINAANAEKATMEQEAKTIAKVLYPMRNNRENGLHLSCWCVFNRVDNLIYPDNVLSVCSAYQAFMGWSENNPVLDDLYQIALEEVQRWHNGVRPMDTTFVYLYWTKSEIYLLDDDGHRFYESDWTKYLDAHA